MVPIADPPSATVGQRAGRLGGHAVVIGGSLAGLLSARVLADHFDQVTIVERDQLPSQPAFRSGVPQSRHLHVLLVRGRLTLEELFPGLEAELLSAGALNIRWPADVLFMVRSRWARRFATGISLLSCSRELIEWTVRCRVMASPKVMLLEGHETVEPLWNAERTAVAGVRVRSRRRHTGNGEAAAASAAPLRAIAAELVVDASGRDSRAPAWLEAAGYSRPPETVINAFLGYASRYYAIPDEAGVDWKGMLISATAQLPRTGGLFPIEGGRWIVTLAGYGRDYPPTEETGFLAFARSLPSPALYDAIRQAAPLSPIRGYQRTENRWRHYERLPRLPHRLVLLGDSVCSFNPVYGQGMTAAALAASVLGQCLHDSARHGGSENVAGLPRRFQAQLARNLSPIWLLATGEDLRYPTTEGARPGLATRLMHRYLDRVIDVSVDDPRVLDSLLRVLHLLDPLTVLFQPRLAVLAFRGAPRSTFAGMPPPARLGHGLAPLQPPPAGGRLEGDQPRGEWLDGGRPSGGKLDGGQPSGKLEESARPVDGTAADDPAVPGLLSVAHGFADFGEVRLHYVEAGDDDPARPLVVLLHGFPEFWYSWRRQIPALAGAGYRVVAPDLRGYNRSGTPTGVESYRIEWLTLDVERLIHQRGAARAAIVGHDWGGAVAWAFAKRFPEMVERLAIVNAPHPLSFWHALRTPRQLRRSAYMFLFQLPWLPEWLFRRRGYAMLRQVFRLPEIRPGAFTDQDIEAYVRAMSRPGRLTAAINYYRALSRRSPRQQLALLRRVDTPALVIWGERDRFLEPDLAQPDPRWVPNARVERLPQASHWPQLDEPDRVNALLLDFIGS